MRVSGKRNAWILLHEKFNKEMKLEEWLEFFDTDEEHDWTILFVTIDFIILECRNKKKWWELFPQNFPTSPSDWYYYHPHKWYYTGDKGI